MFSACVKVQVSRKSCRETRGNEIESKPKEEVDGQDKQRFKGVSSEELEKESTE